MNQAEVLHASWSHRDRPQLSLLDACQADVRDSLLIEVELKGLHSGSQSTGRGPSKRSSKGKETWKKNVSSRRRKTNRPQVIPSSSSKICKEFRRKSTAAGNKYKHAETAVIPLSSTITIVFPATISMAAYEF